jgi:hypothetical protein
MGHQQSSGNGRDRAGRIAARAFDRYLSRGMEPGREMDDWLEAEREIDADGSTPMTGQARDTMAAGGDEAASMGAPRLDPMPRRRRATRRDRTTL